MKDMYFKSSTHQMKLKNCTNNENIIYEISTKLFKEEWDNIPIRLIGIRLDSLTDSNDYQISLFENIDKKINDKNLDKTIDELKKKYGEDIIK